MINLCIMWPLLLCSSNVLPCSVFDIANVKLVSTLRTGKTAFYFVMIQSFLNFSPIPRIRSTDQMKGIGGKFLIFKIFLFLYWSLKGTALICQINYKSVWEAMQEELLNFYQFLYDVIPAVTFQVKSWPHSTFCCFAAY